MSDEKKRQIGAGIWHHITESNWLPFIVIGVMAWYILQLRAANSSKAAIIAQQEIQMKLDQEAMTIIATDLHERLLNVERSKEIEKQKWVGNREVKYK